MNRLIPDSLAGRTIVILVIGLGLFHLWSIWIYRIGTENLLGPARDQGLAERLVSVTPALNELPTEEREHTAHALSSSDLEVHWSETSAIADVAAASERAAPLRQGLLQHSADLAPADLRFGYADAAARRPHALLVAVRLDDGSWTTFGPNAFALSSAAEHDVLGSLSAMAFGILFVSIFLVRSINAPLRVLASAADRIGTDATTVEAPETGAREIRQVARAFNDMQHRIRRLVSDRTQTLAAVSHDLKTPLTRLRLRAEFIVDKDLRETIDDDLDEMERMLDSALAFLRGEATGEESRLVDIGSILETICDQAADAGHDVVLSGNRHAALECRPLALKRALSNLIENAIKYGGGARVALADWPDRIGVTVEDDGPGIPEAERERVFDPFYRIEGSRSRETGGTGLGLTIARTVIRSHGGEIALRNKDSGGLSVTISLPKPTAD